MTYTVECRGGSGSRESLEIEANDRSALFDELKRRGLAAIRVSEGPAKDRRRTAAARSGRGPAVRGALAGLVVVSGALGVWWALSHAGSESADSVHDNGVKSPSAIANGDRSMKANQTAADAPEAVKEPKVNQDPHGLRTYRDERGILRYEGGARVPNQRRAAEPVGVWSNKPKTFRHSAEESIAEVLQLEIGQPILGDFRYGEHFVKSFKESLDEPVEILDTDDAETVALKKDVQATKEDLKKRMESGEDVAAIMNEAMDECRRLGQYRHELEVMRAQYMGDDEARSEQDYIDFTEAANRMLKEKGLPPLAMPRSLRRAMKNRKN